jgi:hypothetical protein
MYGHERSLVQRMAGRPFVLLGVNTDKDREEIRQVVNDLSLGWRSWWDGWSDGHPGGPICESWGVDGFPRIFLIDQGGIVRWHGPSATARSLKQVVNDLDEAVEKLVTEAEKKRS